MEYKIGNLKFVESGSHIIIYRNGEMWGSPQGDHFFKVLLKEIEKVERYETALKEISIIHNCDGFKAKDIAKIALED